jgi:hypothetical protein
MLHPRLVGWVHQHLAHAFVDYAVLDAVYYMLAWESDLAAQEYGAGGPSATYRTYQCIQYLNSVIVLLLGQWLLGNIYALWKLVRPASYAKAFCEPYRPNGCLASLICCFCSLTMKACRDNRWRHPRFVHESFLFISHVFAPVFIALAYFVAPNFSAQFVKTLGPKCLCGAAATFDSAFKSLDECALLTLAFKLILAPLLLRSHPTTISLAYGAATPKRGGGHSLGSTKWRWLRRRAAMRRGRIIQARLSHASWYEGNALNSMPTPTGHKYCWIPRRKECSGCTSEITASRNPLLQLRDQMALLMSTNWTPHRDRHLIQNMMLQLAMSRRKARVIILQQLCLSRQPLRSPHLTQQQQQQQQQQQA